MKKRFLQAYKQAPWRIQIQWIGLFLLGLVLAASIAGLYLNISGQAATTGRRIQNLEYEMGEIQNEIADLTTNLAKEQSVEKMKARAEEMEFKLRDPSTAVYLEIPGFNPADSLVLAPPRINVLSESPSIRSSYRSSLWDWFVQKIWMSASGSATEGGN